MRTLSAISVIVGDKYCTMLTGDTVAEAEVNCRNRFGSRFGGFKMDDLERMAHSKWQSYTDKDLSRPDLDKWLKSLSDEDQRRIRALFNNMRK